MDRFKSVHIQTTRRGRRTIILEQTNKPMKGLLNFYLASALSVTTVATGACFVWYVQEYDAAYKYHKVAPEVSQIHRNNSLWLGLWGGIYGLTGVVSAIGLSQGIKKDK